jgi:hypothetical protein
VHWFIGLKHVGQLGVLLWFSVENYDNGVTSSEFWCVGFTTSLGVEFLSLLFLSVVVMFHSSRLQCRLLRVALFLLCFDRAQAFFCHGIAFTIIVLEALHSRVLGITQNFKWKLFMFGLATGCFGHSLPQYF